MSTIETLVEIELQDSGDFLKIKETLTRIGIKSKDANVLTQSCHILHKAGRYYIVHFKQMFMLDGRETELTVCDKTRLNRVVTLLEKWNLCKVLNNPYLDLDTREPGTDVFIVQYADKSMWAFKSKYKIGHKITR